jgi:3',5'-cyclic AMP phosphodiesterase CpdA
MLIAQISDTHVKPEGQVAYRHVDTATALTRCVEQLCRMRPRLDAGRQHEGLMCGARIVWLEARLREATRRPTVIARHHPPFPTGIAHMHRYGLSGADRLASVIRANPQVERVMCGHLHRPILVRWAGTVASTAPSTAHQVVLDLSEDGPAAFTLEPPGFQLHLWRDDAGLVTHTAFVGDHPGPYPFREGGKLID